MKNVGLLVNYLNTSYTLNEQIKFTESQLSNLNSEIENNQKKYNYYNGLALNTNNNFIRANAIRRKKNVGRRDYVLTEDSILAGPTHRYWSKKSDQNRTT